MCGPAFIRDLPERAARFAQRMDEKAEPENQDVRAMPGRRLQYRPRGGWVNNWRY
jgi:hypothetical protein